MVHSMDKWKNKVAIVTGASAGIGAGIAVKLAECGIVVAGLARRTEKIAELNNNLSNQETKIHPFSCDVSNEQSILEAFKLITKTLGPVHILINNAGVTRNTSLTDGDTEKWRNVIDTNLLGLAIATREAIKIMNAHKIDGHIINMNSIMGHSVPNVLSGLNMYGPSKYAVTCLTETWRQELVQMKSAIKITSISPGAVATEILEAGNIVKEIGDVAFPKDINKILKPEDIAEAVVYVLSTQSHVQVHELIIKPIGEKF